MKGNNILDSNEAMAELCTCRDRAALSQKWKNLFEEVCTTKGTNVDAFRQSWRDVFSKNGNVTEFISEQKRSHNGG